MLSALLAVSENVQKFLARSLARSFISFVRSFVLSLCVLITKRLCWHLSEAGPGKKKGSWGKNKKKLSFQHFFFRFLLKYLTVWERIRHWLRLLNSSQHTANQRAGGLKIFIPSNVSSITSRSFRWHLSLLVCHHPLTRPPACSLAHSLTHAIVYVDTVGCRS